VSRTPVGEALHCFDEAVDHVEALYLQAQGEVTDEIEEAEAARDLTRAEALAALVRYCDWLEGRDAMSRREREATRDRLDRFDASTARRRQWAHDRITSLVRHEDERARKASAGTRVVRLRDTTAVVVGPDFDVSSAPLSWRREVAERVTPARVEIDRKAAAADLRLGYREGTPPGPGWYDVEGLGRMWLWPGRARGSDEPEWWLSHGPEYTGTTLSSQGLSIEPRAGLDVLRWCPAPEGVKLERRVHVSVD